MDNPTDIHHSTLTDVGMKRSHNQDAHGVRSAPNEEVWKQRGNLYVVADGMGAHAVGELASKMAVDTIQLAYHKVRAGQIENALRQAFVEANRAINDKATNNPEFKGMGTTATALVVTPFGAHIGHVGDSRCYRIRENRIEQLSFDHSLHWEIARQKKLDPDEVTDVPKNILARCMGLQPSVEIDVTGPIEVLDGDRFLICSDGLSGPVNDKEMWAAATHLPGNEACRYLADLANIRGGPDNITVVIVQAGDPDAKPEEEEAPAKKSVFALSPPAWLTLAGIVCCGLAYLLGTTGVGGALYAGALGVVLLIAGPSWWMQLRERQKMIDDVPPLPPPPIHRSTECCIDAPLLANMTKSSGRMIKLAEKEKWDIDLADSQQHLESANKLTESQQLDAAYLELAQLLSRLSVALRVKHHRSEVFKPNFQVRG